MILLAVKLGKKEAVRSPAEDWIGVEKAVAFSGDVKTKRAGQCRRH